MPGCTIVGGLEPRCACSRCELIGRKNACEVMDGTCVLLVALCGRPTFGLDTLPDTLPRWVEVPEINPLREGGPWDHPPRCDETAVVGLEIASPVAV
jgi:hypothetical protein